MRTTLALVLALLISACAVQGPPIQRGQELSLAVNPAPEPFAIDTSNAAIKQDAGVGLAGGAAVGALAGLTCGPWAIVCVPAGALVYGLGGAVLGAGAGVVEGPTEEIRHQLLRRLDVFARAHDSREDFSSAIMQRATGHWMIVPASSSTPALEVRLEEATLRILRGRGALFLRARVVLNRPSEKPFEKTFDYVGPESDLSLWIENRDGFVETSFHDGYAFLARAVIGEFAR